MQHQTVMLQTAVDYLQVLPAHWYLDATFGGGGHTREIISRGGFVLAFDFDEEAIAVAQTAFASELAAGCLILIRANFAELTQTINQLRQAQKLPADFAISGVLFDFGTNSDQLKSASRGLSFFASSEEETGPLDMRLDNRLGVTARDLLLALSEKQLTQMLFEYGGEAEAKSLARAIVQHRQELGPEQAFLSNLELADLIVSVKKRHRGRHSSSFPGKSIHPATKTFQALRIVVNNEIDNLVQALPQAYDLLTPTVDHPARFVTIAFHEGEDRPVKQFFSQQAAADPDHCRLITKKPLTPSSAELARNPRSRSAKLRVLEKTL